MSEDTPYDPFEPEDQTGKWLLVRWSLRTPTSTTSRWVILEDGGYSHVLNSAQELLAVNRDDQLLVVPTRAGQILEGQAQFLFFHELPKSSGAPLPLQQVR